MRRARAVAALLGLAMGGTAGAQGVGLSQDANLQRRADGVCALLGYQVVPDITTGSLGIKNGTTGNPDLTLFSLGGGFTWSRAPLYLEGTLAYSRYNPSFVFGGVDGQRVGANWKTLAATGGIGWDFPLAPNLVLRPILNASAGHLESDFSTPPPAGLNRDDRAIRFLEGGRLNLGGFGASLMLDYEDHRPESEIDVELRYTDIRLHSSPGSSDAVQGHATARSFGLYTRYRAPTGWTALDRPVRYVLEAAASRFLGDLEGVLGFTRVATLGAGLELDSSARDVFLKRTRLLIRYHVGNNVTGGSLGIGLSF